MLAGFLILKPSEVFCSMTLAFEPTLDLFGLAVTVLARRGDPDVACDHDFPIDLKCVRFRVHLKPDRR